MDPQNPSSAQHGQHGQQARGQVPPVYDLSLGGHYGASAAVHFGPCHSSFPREHRH
jgi:hypothetical protein